MNTRVLENAHKIVYLVKSYPDKPLNDRIDPKTKQVVETGLFSMIALPAIDINVAIWTAQEYGWLGEADPKTDTLPLLDLPTEWNFGKAQQDFQDIVLTAFKKLGEKETDLEEFSINQWLGGYPPHDIFVTLKYLLDTNQLAEYVIEDGENTYTFYTLYENKDKVWGRKQFKEDPLAGHKEAK